MRAWSLVIVAFVGTAAVGCRTTTTTTRADPVVDGVRVASTRYEPQPIAVAATLVDATKLRLTASQPEKCIQTVVTTHNVVVTEQTRLAEEPRRPCRRRSQM